MPPIQPMQPVPPVPNMGQPYPTASGMPMVQQVQVIPPKKKDVAGLVKTIVIIILSLIALTFIGLFIWMFTQYDDASSDVDGQIAAAVAVAKDDQAAKDEAEFLEREKYPYKTFSGPIDYGELTFEYPKTWSVYIAADASNGGDFEAYFNPIQIDPISPESINALRLWILNEDFESVSRRYQEYLDREDSDLSVSTMTIHGTTANVYTGTIPNTSLNGYIVLFKIRDKTAVFRTDSVLFKEDFDKLLETITFNA